MQTKTTVRFPADLLKEARIKAIDEGLSLSEVLRRLLRLWLRGKVALETTEDTSHQIQLARESFGIWSDRDPDEYLARSRAGLALRDQEVQDARVDI
jgi:Arc/MetJ-type ribon-helix-helix transcriptional regulator